MPQIHRPVRPLQWSQRRKHFDSDPYSLGATTLEFLIDALLWIPRLIAKGCRTLLGFNDVT
jgi:hypothetical protein